MCRAEQASVITYKCLQHNVRHCSLDLDRILSLWVNTQLRVFLLAINARTGLKPAVQRKKLLSDTCMQQHVTRNPGLRTSQGAAPLLQVTCDQSRHSLLPQHHRH